MKINIINPTEFSQEEIKMIMEWVESQEQIISEIKTWNGFIYNLVISGDKETGVNLEVLKTVLPKL